MPPRPPADLRTPGRKFWRDTLALYDLDGPDHSILHEMCRVLDEIELLRAAVERDGATTKGSTGQTVEHPALGGLRAHRGVFERLLGRLDLPDAGALVRCPACGHPSEVVREEQVTVGQRRSAQGHAARWGERRKAAAGGGA